jgi:hypothetical protein
MACRALCPAVCGTSSGFEYNRNGDPPCVRSASHPSFVIILYNAIIMQAISCAQAPCRIQLKHYALLVWQTPFYPSSSTDLFRCTVHCIVGCRHHAVIVSQYLILMRKAGLNAISLTSHLLRWGPRHDLRTCYIHLRAELF